MDFKESLEKVANCETTARVMREEEARLEAIYYRLEEEAERADRVAEIAEAEARRLEQELAAAAAAREKEARDRDEQRRNGGGGGAGASWM